MSSENLIITVVVAFLTGGGIAGLVNALIARRKAPGEIQSIAAGTEKTEAETADILVKIAGQVVMLVKAEFEKKIQNMENEMGKLRNENGSLHSEMGTMRQENMALRDVQLRHEQEISELQAIVAKFEEVLGGAHILYDQVVELKGIPKYQPPARRKRHE